MASRRDSLLKRAVADGYNLLVEGLRATEYPQLNGTLSPLRRIVVCVELLGLIAQTFV